jgi:hypothetical protein
MMIMSAFTKIILLLVVLTAVLGSRVVSSKPKKMGVLKIWKAFWLTLIDPSSEESLKDEKHAAKKKVGPVPKSKALFGKTQSKGRKLGDK